MGVTPDILILYGQVMWIHLLLSRVMLKILILEKNAIVDLIVETV